MSTLSSLVARFNAFDMRRKITLALLSGALLIGASLTLAAYFVARHELTVHATELLGSHALIEQREIELRLSSALALAESLATNTVTANALADSQGRETYLDPLLRNQNLGLDGASISVLDYRGRVAATSRPGKIDDYGQYPLLQRLMREEQAVVGVEMGEVLAAQILVALPIRYRLTGNVEGAVLLHLPLAPLLGSRTWADSRSLIDRQGRTLAGQPAAEEAFSWVAALHLPAPLSALGLQLVVARDRAQVFAALDVLLGIFLGIGALVILGVLAFARIGAAYITWPLREIAAAAEGIAASGRPEAHLPDLRDDEFGRLAAAFNTMVERLRLSYAELEDLVAERTRDYEESQQEAERVGNLLRDAVQSIAVGFTIYDQNDRLVMCNEAYLHLYAISRPCILPGASFGEIIRFGVERGEYADLGTDPQTWQDDRLRRHREACGTQIEQRLRSGRWILMVEHKTPSGYIVGNHIDITELKNTAERLRIRELYQRATLDNLPFFFWLKDAEHRFLAVNKVFADACARSGPEEIVGLNDFDVWPHELAAKYRADDESVLARREALVVEERMASAIGINWIETYKKPVIAADGRVIGTVGFARDIAERKQMEQALAESEARFELAVCGANDGIWDWDIASGKVYFSERWKAMLGYAPGEISNEVAEWRSRIHPDDVAEVLASMERHLHGESEFYTTEMRLLCKGGGYKWILCRGRAKFAENGQAVRMSGSHTDISERRAADLRLRERTEQLNAIFALSPDGFISFDAARRVKYCSPAVARMTGINEAVMSGLDEQAFSDLLAEACIESARFPGMAALRARQVEVAAKSESGWHQGESRQLIELAGPGKRVLEVGVRVAQAETVSQILYLRDVTHETEVDRMKSEFLSTAAHELRTPMVSIFGFSELMLAQECTREEQQEFMEVIYRQSQLMISIINELLDLARIEARRGKDFVFVRLDLKLLPEQVVNSFRAPGTRASPVLRFGQVATTIRGDSKKLTQAINNVLSNAYKYSPGGGAVELDFLARQTDPDGRQSTWVGVCIRDQGIGMTQEQRQRVCERFYRADNSGKIPGTGLGMSIVKEIIELHGGHLEIASEAGLGTAVTLWLPLVD